MLQWMHDLCSPYTAYLYNLLLFVAVQEDVSSCECCHRGRGGALVLVSVYVLHCYVDVHAFTLTTRILHN